MTSPKTNFQGFGNDNVTTIWSVNNHNFYDLNTIEFVFFRWPVTLVIDCWLQGNNSTLYLRLFLSICKCWENCAQGRGFIRWRWENSYPVRNCRKPLTLEPWEHLQKSLTSQNYLWDRRSVSRPQAMNTNTAHLHKANVFTFARLSPCLLTSLPLFSECTLLELVFPNVDV